MKRSTGHSTGWLGSGPMIEDLFAAVLLGAGAACTIVLVGWALWATYLSARERRQQQRERQALKNRAKIRLVVNNAHKNRPE
jgi:hypothetical protein